MYSLLMMAALASAPTSNATLPAGVSQDAKCLTLALVAATTFKDDPDKLKGVAVEAFYFLGRMDAAAPGLDLKPLLTRTANEMQNDPKVKDVGVACDATFTARAVALKNLGGQADAPKP